MNKYPTSLSKYFEMAGHDDQLLTLQFEKRVKMSIVEYSEELIEEKVDYISEKDLISRFPSLIDMDSYERSGLIGGINLFLIDVNRLNNITRIKQKEKDTIYQLLQELVKDRGKLNAVTNLRGDEIILRVQDIYQEFLSNFPEVVEKFRQQMSVKKLFDPKSSVSYSRVLGNCPLLCYERGHPDGTIQNCVVFLAMSVPERIDFIDNTDHVNKCCLVIYGHNEAAPCPDNDSGCTFCWDKSHHSSLCDRTTEARTINSLGCIVNRKRLHDMQTGGQLYTNPPPGFPRHNPTTASNLCGGASVVVNSKKDLRWEFSDKLHTDSMILTVVLSFFSDRLLTRRHIQIQEDGYLSVNIQEITLNLLERNYSESFNRKEKRDSNAMLMVKAAPAVAVLQKFIEAAAGPLSDRVEVLDLLPSYLSVDLVRGLDPKSSVLWEEMCDQFGRQDPSNEDNSPAATETDHTLVQEQMERIEKQELLLVNIRNNINDNFREMHSINAGLQSNIKQLWHKYSGLRIGNAMSPIEIKKMEMDNILKSAAKLTKSLNFSRVDLMKHFNIQECGKSNTEPSDPPRSEIWEEKVNKQMKILQDKSQRGKNLDPFVNRLSNFRPVHNANSTIRDKHGADMAPITTKMVDPHLIRDVESDSSEEHDGAVNKNKEINADEKLADAEDDLKKLHVAESEPRKGDKDTENLFSCPLVSWKHEHWGLSLGNCSLFRGLSQENRRNAVKILNIPPCCLSDEIHSLGQCGQIVTCRYCEAKAHSSLLCYSRPAVAHNERIYLLYKEENMKKYPQISSESAYAEFEEQCSTVDIRCDTHEMQEILGTTADENCGAVWESTVDSSSGQNNSDEEKEDEPDDDVDHEAAEDSGVDVVTIRDEGESQANPTQSHKDCNDTGPSVSGEPSLVTEASYQPDDNNEGGREETTFNFLPLFSVPINAPSNSKTSDGSCNYVLFRLDDDGSRHEVELDQVCPGVKNDGLEGIHCERRSWKYWDHIMNCTTINQLNSLARSKEEEGKFYVIGDPDLYEDLKMLAEEAESDESLPDLHEQDLPEDENEEDQLPPPLEDCPKMEDKSLGEEEHAQKEEKLLDCEHVHYNMSLMREALNNVVEEEREKPEKLEEKSASNEELKVTNETDTLRALREKIWRSRSHPSLDIDNRELLQKIVVKKQINPPLRKIFEHGSDPICSYNRSRYATLTHKQACSDCLLSIEEFEELRALTKEKEEHGEFEFDPFSSPDDLSETESLMTDLAEEDSGDTMNWLMPKGDPQNPRLTIFPEKIYIEQKTESLAGFVKDSLTTATSDALLIQLELAHHIREKAASFFSQYSIHPMICEDGVMTECRDILEDMQKKIEVAFSRKKAEESGESTHENACMAQEEDITSSEQESKDSSRSKLDIFFGTNVPLTEETIRGEQTNAWDMESLMCEDAETQLHYIEAGTAMAKYLDSNIYGMNSTRALFTIGEISRLLLFIFCNKNIREPSNRHMIVCDPETESCFNMKCFHLSQLHRAIAKMVKTAGRDVSARTEEELPFFLPPPEKRKKTRSKKKLRIIKNVNTNFYVKHEFLELLRTLPRVDQENTVFSYYDLADLLGEYLLEHKSTFMDGRNPFVVYIAGSPLGRVFGCRAFHMSQIFSMLSRATLLFQPQKGDVVEVVTVDGVQVEVETEVKGLQDLVPTYYPDMIVEDQEHAAGTVTEYIN